MCISGHLQEISTFHFIFISNVKYLEILHILILNVGLN